MKKIFVLILVLQLASITRADEGMWMIPLIKKLNVNKMNGMGLTLTAEDIYSETKSSLKDAVVVFGGGCTGVMVSSQGLLFTNHHCGYDAIQKNSTIEKNYLKNGFSAEKLSDEISCPGLTVKFLVKIQDVTERVNSELPEKLTGRARNKKQDSICNVIQKEAQKDTLYTASVNSFYSNNEFYLFVYQEFKDIRLAFAPPSSVGKFGGETDNWMWPRHTGDFSVFRVYSSPDGKPAAFSSANIPYTPLRYAHISNKGYKDGDFTMIMGNPGSTNRYLSSWGTEYRVSASNQARIDVRGAKQAVWKSFMEKDEAINIAYASKYARSSNYWKNSIGMNNAIKKLNIIAEKEEKEKEFKQWIENSESRQNKYANVLQIIADSYTTAYPYGKSLTYLLESLYGGIELPRIAENIEGMIEKKVDNLSIRNYINDIYKDYYATVDEATLVAMLDIYKKSVEADALPDVYKVIDKKFAGDYHKYAKKLYEKSVFTSKEKILKYLLKKNRVPEKDPAILLALDIRNVRESITSKHFVQAMEKLRDAERIYLEGIKEMEREKGNPIYPDANFTMRLTYGKIGGYKPADAVSYNYFTTTNGILQKEIKGSNEFEIPQKLKESIIKKDFGVYADKTSGQMHVAFLSNNDITGGNSGSPIFNSKGELIGLAFDGNWDAMSGDIIFEPELQRTINVDIRYILYIMDKIANSSRLIKELTIE